VPIPLNKFWRKITMKDFGKKKEEDNSAFEEYHDPQGAYIKSNIEGIIGDNEGGKEEIK